MSTHCMRVNEPRHNECAVRYFHHMAIDETLRGQDILQLMVLDIVDHPLYRS